jgi:hypothetical protein
MRVVVDLRSAKWRLQSAAYTARGCCGLAIAGVGECATSAPVAGVGGIWFRPGLAQRQAEDGFAVHLGQPCNLALAGSIRQQCGDSDSLIWFQDVHPPCSLSMVEEVRLRPASGIAPGRQFSYGSAIRSRPLGGQVDINSWHGSTLQLCRPERRKKNGSSRISGKQA